MWGFVQLHFCRAVYLWTVFVAVFVGVGLTACSACVCEILVSVSCVGGIATGRVWLTISEFT